MENGDGTLEKSLVVPQMTKHGVTTQPINSTLRYTLKRSENVCPCENWYTNVYSSISHNSQEVETTEMFINGLMEKQNEVHPYPHNGIFSHKKEQY